MNIVAPSFHFMHVPDGEFILRHLEQAARTCYKSEDKVGPDSARNLLKRIIRMGHNSVLEHISVTVRIVCDRGVSHELVRHRLCSFSQESTRYANYAHEKFGNSITVIRPFFGPKMTSVTSSGCQPCRLAKAHTWLWCRQGLQPRKRAVSCPTA